MASREVSVRLKAEVAGYKSAMQEAAAVTRKLKDHAKQTAAESSGAFDRMRKSAQANRDQWESAGQTASTVGLLTVGALGASAKAAIDWESAWAGVTKTVDGTPEQMAAIEAELRGLAKTLPATHQEIAAVAEAAGALGVKSEDIVGFTETMINLGETTNLTADEAATSLAQLMNVMGTSGDDVNRLGSAVVELGNNGASTERDIVQMAQRIGGAGAQIGLTEGEVLGFASALSSVGIEAEAGGSSISKVMIDIASSVDKGGERLDQFAEIAGMSSEEFARAFEEDAAGAIQAFITGLGNAEAQGDSTLGMLEELGITEIRTRDGLLRLAASGDLLTESLRTGNSAWEENTALTEEAAKRYETTEAKIQIAWNNIKDAAIEAGSVILPVVAGLAEAVAGVANWFSELPGPAKTAFTILGTVGGAATLAAGGFLLLAPRVFDTIDGFKRLRAASPGVASGIGKIGRAAGIAGAAYGAATLAAKAFADAANEANTDTSVERFTNALTGAADNADRARESVNGLFQGVEKIGTGPGVDEMFTAVNDLGSALDRVFNPSRSDNISDFFSTLFGQNASSGINVTKDAIADLDGAIAQIAQGGNIEDAQAAFQIVNEKAAELEIPIEELLTLFPQYQEVLAAAATEAGHAGIKQDELNALMLGAPGAIDVTKASADQLAVAYAEAGGSAEGLIADMATLLDQMLAAGLITLSVRDANRAYQESLDAVDTYVQQLATDGIALSSVLNKNGTDFNITTAAGRGAQAAFDDIARAGMDATTALAENGATQEEVQGSLKQTYDGLYQAALGFDMSEEAARQLTREVLGIPDGVSIDSWMDASARIEAENTKAALDRIPSQIYTRIVTEKVEILTTEDNRARRVGTGPAAFALGGPINGGVKGRDSVPIMAMPGEHMLTVQDVANLGGHEGVYQLRAAAAMGLPGFAAGGPVREFAATATYHLAAASNSPTIINNLHMEKSGIDDQTAVFQGLGRSMALAARVRW